jgi:hypothetical protein
MSRHDGIFCMHKCGTCSFSLRSFLGKAPSILKCMNDGWGELITHALFSISSKLRLFSRPLAIKEHPQTLHIEGSCLRIDTQVNPKLFTTRC